MALFVLAFALALEPSPRRVTAEQAAGRRAGGGGARRRPHPRRGERVHLQPPRPRLVRARAAALARARGARGRSADRLARRCRRGARRTGSRSSRPRSLIVARDRCVAVGPATRLRRQDRRRPGVGRPARARRSSRARRSGIWPAGRLPDRPRRGLAARCPRSRSARSRSPTAPGAAPAPAQLALLAMLVAGAVVYVGARAFAEIHVEAKALAVIAPLVLLVGAARRCSPPASAPSDDRWSRSATRLGRDASWSWSPPSPRPCSRCAPPRSASTTAQLGPRAARRAGRGRAGRLPRRRPLRRLLPARHARCGPRPATCRRRSRRAPRRRWQQGTPPTSTRSTPGKLDKFDYAITTTAAYASTPPPNFEPVAARGRLRALAARRRRRRAARVLDGGRRPGRDRSTASSGEGRRLASARGTAVVLAEPALVDYTDWTTPPPVDAAAGGQERASPPRAPRRAELDLPRRGQLRALAPVPLARCRSSVLRRRRAGRRRCRRRSTACTSSGAGRGAFWPAGELEQPTRRAGTRSRSRAAEPNGLQDALGVERRVWLGDLAATPDRRARERAARATRAARYVDHFTLERGAGWLMPHRGPRPSCRRRSLGGVRGRSARRASRRSSSSAAPGAAAPTCSRSCSRATERLALIPVEVRFHTDPDGFPGLLAGEVTWSSSSSACAASGGAGFQTRRMRGMYRFVDRERFDAAVDAVRARLRRRPRGGLPRPLLRPALRSAPRSARTARGDRRAELPTPSPRRRRWSGSFPRRASSTSSATAATPRPRGSRRPAAWSAPRTREQGIDWWEERIEAIERGRARRSRPSGC